MVVLVTLNESLKRNTLGMIHVRATCNDLIALSHARTYDAYEHARISASSY